MIASDRENCVQGRDTLTKDSKHVKAVDVDDFEVPSWLAKPMRAALMGLVGKEVALYGLSGEKPNVMLVESAGTGAIRGVIKDTGEEVHISEGYVLFVQRASSQTRKAFLSRSKGCEFILRLANTSPTVMVW